jgi:hypothetical protein
MPIDNKIDVKFVFVIILEAVNIFHSTASALAEAAE